MGRNDPTPHWGGVVLYPGRVKRYIVTGAWIQNNFIEIKILEGADHMRQKLKKVYWDEIAFSKKAGTAFQSFTLFLGTFSVLSMIFSFGVLYFNINVGTILFFVTLVLLLLYLVCVVHLFKLRPYEERLIKLREWLESTGLYSDTIIEYLIQPKKGLFGWALDRSLSGDKKRLSEDPMFSTVVGGLAVAAITAVVKMILWQYGIDIDAPDKNSAEPGHVVNSILMIIFIVAIVIIVLVALYTIFVSASLSDVAESTLNKDLSDLLAMKKENVNITDTCKAMGKKKCESSVAAESNPINVVAKVA